MGARNVKTSSATSTKRKTLVMPKTGKGKQSSKSGTKKGGDNESADITPEERNRLIAEAAYFRAEQHGFKPEEHEKNWLEAEAEVDAMLKNVVHQVDTETSH